MAESALDRLKRLAAEKKAAAQKVEPSTPGKEEKEEKQDAFTTANSVTSGSVSRRVELPESAEGHGGLCLGESASTEKEGHDGQSGKDLSPSVLPGAGNSDSGLGSGGVLSEVTSAPKASPTHPIAMEMAELEQALNSQVPGFHGILRDIHIKLREDPNVVTLLSDEEISVIVKGLERHANITLTSKAAKKTTGAKSKVPVSAADL